ncbi:MAG: tail fiber domain-containing protein [Ignavibacteriaceae bacterium]|nr:tail fiber domain-containing protein [Ignavibacteriaceae bacterium]
MKNSITFLISVVLLYASVNAQTITNTIGTTGSFIVQDANINPLVTITGSNGSLNLFSGLMFKGANRYFHSYRAPSTIGYNTFVGENSGNFTMFFVSSSLDASSNSGFGYASLSSLTTGYNNTGIGYDALKSNTDGNWNTALGANALRLNTSGEENTALGFHSMSSNTIGIENTAVGALTMYLNTTGNANSGFGYYTLHNNTTGSYNTATGHSALFSNTTGRYNTASGFYSLYANTIGEFNTATGDYSLYTNTTGHRNTTSGYFSLALNLTGDDNTAMGHKALAMQTNGSFNSAFGSQALELNTTGASNSTFGYYSMNSNQNGTGNAAFGVVSMQNNISGNFNAAFGFNSLNGNTIGMNNTAVGTSALQNAFGASDNNTAIGASAGLQVTTGSNLVLVGYNAQPSFGNVSNEITLGDAFITTLRANVTTITSLSDARDKKEIQDLGLGLNFIMKVKPRLYHWDKREWYSDNKSDGSKMSSTPTAGFIAQELDELQISENSEWLNLVLKTNSEKFEATPGNLLPVIVKAVQDLKIEKDAEIAAKDLQIAELKKLNDELLNNQKQFSSRLEDLEKNQEFLMSEISKILVKNEFSNVVDENSKKR